MSTESISLNPTSPPSRARPKSHQRTSGTKHKTGMGYKSISKKPGEKVTTAGAIIQKWKKYRMNITSPRCRAPCKILLHGMRMIMRKVMDQTKTTQVVCDLNTVGTTVTENTTGNTPQRNQLKSCSVHKSTLLRHMYRLVLSFPVNI